MIWSFTCILPSVAAALPSATLFTKIPDSSSEIEMLDKHEDCRRTLYRSGHLSGDLKALLHHGCSTRVLDFSRVFLAFLSRFYLRFGYQHVGIQDASENARKMQEKREKNPKREPNARKCFYITLYVGQERESVAFFTRFARVFYAFWS